MIGRLLPAKTSETAKEHCRHGVSPILLDIKFAPMAVGLNSLRRSRTTPGLLLALLTANDTDLDIVRGADDYTQASFLRFCGARGEYPTAKANVKP